MAENKTKRPEEEEEDDRSWREGVCPYYMRDRGRGHIYCEGAVFRFPDIKARREYVYAYCAHPTGYGRCPLKQVMDHFYERRFDKSETGEPVIPCPLHPEPQPTGKKHRKHSKRKEAKKNG